MINIKSKNTDFWMDKVINNEQIWEGYFLNEKITEKSKIVYTGFLNEEKVLNAIEDICNEVNLSFDCDPEKKLFIKVFNSPENIPDFIKEVLVFEDEEFIEEETSMDYETLDYTLKNVLKEPLINRKIIDILNSNMKIMF